MVSPANNLVGCGHNGLSNRGLQNAELSVCDCGGTLNAGQRHNLRGLKT